MSIRAPLRWKEWIPLATQQQRLRNLIQIMAYNMTHERVINSDSIEKYSYYYTLHSTTMSSPFYMSEKIESEHPKWVEVEIDKEYGTYTGVIIRLWRHSIKTDCDDIILLSGVYFSGLVYIGQRLLTIDPALFKGNTIIFYMHGGYFTSPTSFLNIQPEDARITTISLDPKDVRPSYTLNMLSKLHSLQHEIKLESKECDILRQKILMGGDQDKSMNRGNSATLRKLLSRNKPKTPKEHIINIKKEIEDVKFRVQLLKQEKKRKENDLKLLLNTREHVKGTVNDLGCDLMIKFRNLNKDIIRLKDRKKLNGERKQTVNNVTAQLLYRRRHLISDLNYIYPIVEISENRYEICNVYLPNSEDFGDKNETAIAVALGLVTQLVEIISMFLNIPLRYPVIHFSSRSKIIDHITVDIPDNGREFALFPRGSSYKLQFHYGVYLLNKNIAQLRLDCGLVTNDLRATLPNLYALLNQRKVLDAQSRRRSMSGSNLESSCSTPVSSTISTPTQSQQSSSLGSSPKYFHKNMSEPIMIHVKSKDINELDIDSRPSSNESNSHLDLSKKHTV